MRARSIALFAALLGACSFTPAGSGGSDGGDDGGDGGDDAPPDSACQPYCFGDDLITCSAGGPDPPVTCALGCSTTGGAHCRALVPSNGATAADLDGVTGDLLISTGFVFYFDTDDGSIVSALRGSPAVTSPVRAAGPGILSGINFRVANSGTVEVAVFAFRSLSIQPSDAVVRSGLLRGVGSRPLLILVDDTIDVSGAIDVGAGVDDRLTGCQRCAGPGGGDGGDILALSGTGDGVGCAPGGHGNYYSSSDETGGGGGGFGTPGATGGDSGVSQGGAIGPLTACSDDTLVPLRGGSGGGRGGYDSSNQLGGVDGGGGGGAIQLTSMTAISVGVSADIWAGGAGGEGSVSNYGGGGGGSGGGILLEAPTITIAGVVTANGGGGGSGRESNRGENGNRATQRASGGAGSGIGNNDGRGGLGSIGPAGNQAATPGYGNVDGTGGGGGGAGIIRLDLVGAPTITGAVISPPHTVGAATIQ